MLLLQLRAVDVSHETHSIVDCFNPLFSFLCFYSLLCSQITAHSPRAPQSTLITPTFTLMLLFVCVFQTYFILLIKLMLLSLKLCPFFSSFVLPTSCYLTTRHQTRKENSQNFFFYFGNITHKGRKDNLSGNEWMDGWRGVPVYITYYRADGEVGTGVEVGGGGQVKGSDRGSGRT